MIAFRVHSGVVLPDCGLRHDPMPGAIDAGAKKSWMPIEFTDGGPPPHRLLTRRSRVHTSSAGRAAYDHTADDRRGDRAHQIEEFLQFGHGSVGDIDDIVVANGDPAGKEIA